MAEKKQTKPAAKTTAENKPKIFEVIPEPKLFGCEPGDLPPITDEHAPVSGIANVAAASGLFGDYTPAQIAVLILAGRELGFGSIGSLFNLRFEFGAAATDHATILFRSDPPFLLLKDALFPKLTISSEKIPISINLPDKDDLSAFSGEQASEAGTMPERLTRQTDGGKTTAINEPCPVCFDDSRKLETLFDLYGLNFFVCSEKCFVKAKELYFKPPGESARHPKQIEHERDPEKDESAARDMIKFFCQQLDINAGEKLKKFDSMPDKAQKIEYFQTVQKYYAGKCDAIRSDINGVFIENKWNEASQKTYVAGIKGNRPETDLIADMNYKELSAVLAEMRRDKMI